MHDLILVPGAARAEEEQVALCDRAGGVLLRPGALPLSAFAARVLAACGDERAVLRPAALRLLALDGPLGPWAAGAVATLYEEAILAGLSPERLPPALAAAAPAVQALHARLAKARALSPAGALAAAARRLEEGMGAAALTGVKAVAARGFVELAPAALDLLRAVSRHRPSRLEVAYDADRPLDWPLADRLLSRVEAGWDQPGALEVEIVPPARPEAVSGIVARSQSEAARATVAWVRRALEEGVPPDGVAVIALRPTARAAAVRALAAAGVPLAVPAPSAESPLGRALVAALAAAEAPDQGTLLAMASAAGQQGLASLLARAGVARGTPAALASALAALAEREERGRRRARAAAGFAARAAAALDAVARAGSLAAQLSAARDLLALLAPPAALAALPEEMSRRAGQSPSPPPQGERGRDHGCSEDGRILRAHLLARRAAESALGELSRAAARLGSAPAAPTAALAKVVREALASAGHRPPGPVSAAVRVCSPAEAAGRAWERVAVVGCEEAPWGRGLAGLVDFDAWAEATARDRDRSAALARTLFSAAAGAARGALLLVAAPPPEGAPHPFASDCLASAGGRWAPAPHGLLAASDAPSLLAAAVAEADTNPVARAVIETVGGEEVLARAEHVVRRAEGDRAGLLGEEAAQALATRLEARGRWSATALEEYARCPFLFFGRRGLGLRSLDEPTADLAPREEGKLLHRALKRIFETFAARGALPFRGTPQELALARAAVEEAFAQAEAAGQVGDPRAAAARRAALARLVERVVLEEAGATDGFAPAAFELPFESLPAGGVLLSGAIDRVDLAADGVRIVDYKRGGDAGGRHRTLAREAGDVTGGAFQLPVYLAAAEEWARARGVLVERRRAAYLLLGNGKRLEAEPFDGAVGAVRLHRALDEHVARVVAGVRAGRFPPAPREPCGPCEQAPVCRYRGEMREAG